MMSKLYFALSLFITFSIQLQAQESPEPAHILDAQEWGSEFFTFPIKFATEIPYTGYEEAVFPPGWSKEESPEFWSYVFAWKIEASVPLAVIDFETNLQFYFDGLMDLQNRKNGTTIFVTKASLAIDNTNTSGDYYSGTLYLYEGRYANKMMTLYTKAEQHYCKKNEKATVIFRFSPTPFDGDIWKSLNAVVLAASHSCD